MFVHLITILIFVIDFGHVLAIPSFLVQEDVNSLLTSRGEKMAFPLALNSMSSLILF
jgi:hypothetical protein